MVEQHSDYPYCGLCSSHHVPLSAGTDLSIKLLGKLILVV